MSQYKILEVVFERHCGAAKEISAHNTTVSHTERYKSGIKRLPDELHVRVMIPQKRGSNGTITLKTQYIGINIFQS